MLARCIALTQVTDKALHLLRSDADDLVDKDLALDLASLSSYFLFLLLLKLSINLMRGLPVWTSVVWRTTLRYCQIYACIDDDGI